MLKFDTGMNRLGFMQNEIENMMHRLKPFKKDSLDDPPQIFIWKKNV